MKNKQIFICIDTNIYIDICLSSRSGEDYKVLTDLKEILNKNEAKVLLPMTVKSEFNRNIANVLRDAKNYFVNAENAFKLNSKELKKIKLDVESNFIKGKETVLEIFNHPNTITTDITPEVITNAFKMQLQGLKPSSKDNKTYDSNNSIITLQGDCLIIEEIKAYLDDTSDYLLYICTGNKKDFSDEKNKEKLHKDISNYFKNSELYLSLPKLLNIKFKSNINEAKLSDSSTVAIVTILEDANKQSYYSPNYAGYRASASGQAWGTNCVNCGHPFYSHIKFLDENSIPRFSCPISP